MGKDKHECLGTIDKAFLIADLFLCTTLEKRESNGSETGEDVAQCKTYLLFGSDAAD